MVERHVARSVRLAALVFLVALPSCVDGPTRTASGAEALGAGGASSLCTHTPDEWATRCAAHVGPAALCGALSRARTADRRERAALDLNIATQTGLGAQHFVHGARIAWSVGDVARVAGSGGSSSTNVAGAVRDANRAYADCVDHAVLADWVTTPVCGCRRVPTSRGR